MADEIEEKLRVEPLTSSYDRSGFESGVFPDVGGPGRAEEHGRAIRPDTPHGTVAGYYTLSPTSVQLGELPAQTVRKLPRYPLVPGTLLGRLAVDRRQQRKGYGRFLLADALLRAVRSEIASFAVLVDAKDDNAGRFYERESFVRFPDQPITLVSADDRSGETFRRTTPRSRVTRT